MNKAATLNVCLLWSLALGGCGGGGGGNGSSNSSGSSAGVPPAIGVEGVYHGTLSNGLEHATMVLDDGRYYILYGTTASEGFTTSGFLQGSGQANHGSFASSDLKDFARTGAVTSGTLSAAYTGTSLNGTVTGAGATLTFTSTPTDVAVLNYNIPASLSSISGVWHLTSMQSEAVFVNVAANGSFFAALGECAITGTFTPRASGKNVFDVSQTFGPSCTLAGQSASGIAIAYPLTSAGRQLIIAETSASRANGLLWFGVR